MRLEPILPENLSPELLQVHDEIAALVARTQERIVVLNEQNALIGPFPAMLHFPEFGVPALIFQRALSTEAKLSKTVREVAILTVGAVFGARYEIYAHEITAAEVGLTRSQIATIAAGNCPSDLNEAEIIAFEVAKLLSTGRILPTSTYSYAIKILGKDCVGELVFLIGGYCLIAMILNAFDVPIPNNDI